MLTAPRPLDLVCRDHNYNRFVISLRMVFDYNDVHTCLIYLIFSTEIVLVRLITGITKQKW